MIIRPLNVNDRDQWAPLWAGYLEFYKTELSTDVTEAAFQRLTGEASNMFAFVVEENARVIGFVHCVTHPATWAIGDYCYLEDLFVSPRARGTGAGRALIEAVYVEADKRGCARVYWHTNETNTTARALYDKVARYAGFIQYRRS